MKALELLRRTFRVEPGEGRPLAWSFAYFFLLLSSYYVLRPVRDAMGASGGENRLTWLYMGTLLGTTIATPIMGALASRHPRRVFVPIVYHFLAACLVVFWALLFFLDAGGREHVSRVFFVWVSVFNLFAISVFWGFMTDLYRSEQGKRLFGVIALGGTLGAMAGAAATALLVKAVGVAQILLLAAFLLELAVLCVRRLAAGAMTGGVRSEDAEKPPGRGVWNGLRVVTASPYLLGICLFLLLYSVTSTLLYFEQARIVRAALPDAAGRTAFFARMDLMVNLLAATTQALLTGRILLLFGVGATLAILPTLTLAGLTALTFAHSLTTIACVQVIRRAAEFALVRPARELLFTIVSREEKYVSKSFIDTFVYRGGDAGGAWLDRLLATLGVGLAGVTAAFAPFAAAWVLLALLLGRHHTTVARAPNPASPASAGG